MPIGTHKPDGEVVAVKVMSRKVASDEAALTQEVDILRSLDHHQVVRYVLHVALRQGSGSLQQC